jgi:V/A-type H+-transporting ATPase subunit D
LTRLAVNPNRMELLKLKRRAAVAVRGHKLLKDKMDELLKQFLGLVRENRELRASIEADLAEAYGIFAMARSEMTVQEVEEALEFPAATLALNLERRSITGVKVPAFKLVAEGDFDSYGLGLTPASFDEAMRRFSLLVPRLVELAEVETAVMVMAMEIEKTRRRVNALEYVLIPSLQETISYITMKLDELERFYRTQLMKIKSMQEAATGSL